MPETLYQSAGVEWLTMNGEALCGAVTRKHDRHGLRKIHQFPAPALQTAFVLEKSLAHVYMRQTRKKLPQHVAESIFLIEVGTLPMRLDYHEPNHAGHRSDATPLPWPRLSSVIGAPLAFETACVWREVEMTFPSRAQLAILKLEPMLFESPFQRAGSGSLIESQDPLGFLDEPQQAEGGFPNPLELTLSRPR